MNFIKSKRGVALTDHLNERYSWTYYPEKNKLFFSKKEFINNKIVFTRVNDIDCLVSKKTTLKDFLALVNEKAGHFRLI